MARHGVLGEGRGGRRREEWVCWEEHKLLSFCRILPPPAVLLTMPSSPLPQHGVGEPRQGQQHFLYLLLAGLHNASSITYWPLHLV